MTSRVEWLLGRTAPLFREACAFVLQDAQRLLDESDPGLIQVVLTSTARDADRQLELFKQGRRFENGKWEVVDKSKVVTNARAEMSAHCVRDQLGRPAALAADFVLKERATGQVLRSHPLHPAWAVIPFAAYRAPTELVVGAGFRSLQDWGHIEVAGWKRLLGPDGRLEVTTT